MNRFVLLGVTALAVGSAGSRPVLSQLAPAEGEALPRACVAADFASGPSYREVEWLGSTSLPATAGSALFRDKTAQVHWVSDGTPEGTRPLRLPCEVCSSQGFPTGWFHSEYLASSSATPIEAVAWTDAKGNLVSFKAADGRRLTLGSSYSSVFAAGSNVFLSACDERFGCQLWSAKASDGVAVPLGGFSLQDALAVGSALYAEDYFGRPWLVRRGVAPLALVQNTSQILTLAARGLGASMSVRYYRIFDYVTRKTTLWRLEESGATGPLAEWDSSPTHWVQAGDAALAVQADGKAWLAERGQAKARSLAALLPSSFRGFVGVSGGRAVVWTEDGLVAHGPSKVDKLSPACAGSSCPTLGFAAAVGARFLFSLSDNSLWSTSGLGAPLRLWEPCEHCGGIGFDVDPGSGLARLRGRDGYWISDGTVAGTRRVDSGRVSYDARWVGTRLLSLNGDNDEHNTTVVAHEAGKAPRVLIDFAAVDSSGGPSSLAAAGFGIVGSLGDAGAFALADGSYYSVSLRFGYARPLRAPSGAVFVSGSRDTGLNDQHLWAWTAPDLLLDLGPSAGYAPVGLGDAAAWTGDGQLRTAQDSTVLADFSVGGLRILGSTGERLYLVDSDGLTVSDGTPAGTIGVHEGRWYEPALVAHRGGAALLTNRYSGSLWISDGTAAGTRILKALYRHDAAAATPTRDFLFGARGRSPQGSAIFGWSGGGLAGIAKLEDRVVEAAALGERVVFVMAGQQKGEELWTTDGTAAGTRLLVDLWPGPFGSRPRLLTPVPGGLVFSALRPDVGRELWFTDGTSAGTRLLADVESGIGSSLPADFQVFGSDLYFSAHNAETGRELFRVPLQGGGCGSAKGEIR
jgi:ELWxxDGT repeat protein